MLRPARLLPAALLLVTLAPPPHAAATEAEPAPTAQQRRVAMQQTLDAINAEVEARGGSWEAWAARLKPMREDMLRIRGTKWPWKTERNFRFLGRAMSLLMIDDLNHRPDDQRPLDAIVHLDRQLKARGIDLIVMPIPDKISIYPDYLSKQTPDDRLVSLAAKRLLADLLEHDVEVIDLHTLFRDKRRALGEDMPLYYDRDSHWRNNAAQLAAAQIADRLKRYDFVQAALKQGSPYTLKAHRREDGAKADDVKLVIRRDSGKRYQDADRSPVILTGDSFSMYNMHLGGHLSAHVAHQIGLPVSYICQSGLSHGMPAELAKLERKGDYLRDRRVVVWTFCARSFTLKGWRRVNLGGEAADAPQLKNAAVTGTIAAVSPAPPTDSPYAQGVMKLQLADATDAKGNRIGDGRLIVRFLGMKEHKLTPAASVKAGQSVRVTLSNWEAVKEEHKGLMTMLLDDIDAELVLPHYWGEGLQPAAEDEE